VRYRLKDCAVIYRHDRHIVVKQPGGRAILVYGRFPALQPGICFDATVRRLNRYHGNLEITRLADIRRLARTVSPAACFLDPRGRDLADRGLRNEVVGELRGVYRGGLLYYGSGRRIRLFFPERCSDAPAGKAWLPKSGQAVIVKGVRIGYHSHPELIIERAGQIRPAKAADVR
jgi:hypothetical protein